jgi:SAM-dependent methyltransferase
MGLHLKREKKRVFLLSFFYKISKILFIVSSKRRLNLYLTLEWIFDRLAHEESFNYFPYEKHPLRFHTINFIKKHVTPTDIVLDLGSGYGDMSNKLAELSKKVVGVDYVKGDVEIAKSRHTKPNLKFIYGDAFKYLESCNQKFDIIILSHILEHIDNPIEFLKKCVPYTKKIFIEVPDYDKTYLNHYRTLLNNKIQYTDADHVWEFDREELFELIKNCNLRVLDSDFRFGVMKIWCETY